MSSALEALENIIPVAIVGGIALNLADRAFSNNPYDPPKKRATKRIPRKTYMQLVAEQRRALFGY